MLVRTSLVCVEAQQTLDPAGSPKSKVVEKSYDLCILTRPDRIVLGEVSQASKGVKGTQLALEFTAELLEQHLSVKTRVCSWSSLRWERVTSLHSKASAAHTSEPESSQMAVDLWKTRGHSSRVCSEVWVQRRTAGSGLAIWCMGCQGLRRMIVANHLHHTMMTETFPRGSGLVLDLHNLKP